MEETREFGRTVETEGSDGTEETGDGSEGTDSLHTDDLKKLVGCVYLALCYMVTEVSKNGRRRREAQHEETLRHRGFSSTQSVYDQLPTRAKLGNMCIADIKDACPRLHNLTIEDISYIVGKHGFP